jgi:hypothetical protein
MITRAQKRTMTGLLRRKHATPATPVKGRQALTIRPAGPADAEAIERLAQLDSTRPPGGDVLVAEVAGELWAAFSLDDGHAVSDPFRPSGELVFVLAERARALRPGRRHGRRRLRAQPIAGV